VPLDFSALAGKVLERAKEYGREFGSKLILVHAVEPIIQPAEYAIVPSEMAEINLRQAEASRKRLEEVKRELEQDGLSCEVEVKLGRPWRVIVETAKKAKADLIIIPTHGYGGIKHLLLGSTAERVVQHAECSVLVVR
jgi:nucleotide-binding universal stress UspA family protein